MIPKTIHYCWFGGKPLPALAIKCINSWKKHLPDYEIVEWNESNFDVNMIPYTQEAYEAGKYAFVSDYARFWILYNFGGVYFDTDVEVIKPIDDIVARGPFMGAETRCCNNVSLAIAPGLGLACEPANSMYKDLLGIYQKLHFRLNDGTMNLKTIVQYTTDYLLSCGLKQVNDIQCLNNLWIYPKDYFCPIDQSNNQCVITSNTRTIHHFAGSWVPKKIRYADKLRKYIGGKNYLFLLNLKRAILGQSHIESL